MNLTQIITLIVRGISTLTHNPALGGGGIGSERSSILLDMLATLIEGGTETAQALREFSKEIEALVATNGEPTRGQWDAMIARDLAARKALDDNLAAIKQAENDALAKQKKRQEDEAAALKKQQDEEAADLKLQEDKDALEESKNTLEPPKSKSKKKPIDPEL